jgi:hypothetical protein
MHLRRRDPRKKTAPKIRPVIAIPLERTSPFADVTTWWKIGLAQQGYPFIRLPAMPLIIARSMFANHLLESQFTQIFMLDEDHDHAPDVVERLCNRVAEDPTRQVVGGLAFRRGEPFEPCAYVVEGDEVYSIAKWEPNSVIKVDRITLACTIIAREVFEALPPPWFNYDLTNIRTGKWQTEDIYFSKLCQEHGIDLWLDTGTTNDHLTIGRINESTWKHYQAAWLAKQEAQHDSSIQHP